MRCSKCAAENREGRKFCAQCGAPLNARCTSCGAENEPAEKFCGECGVALAGKVQAVSAKAPATQLPAHEFHVAPGQPQASAAPEGERKTVTALFADIKGSTELMEDLDPEEARAIIDPALKLMIEAVRRYDGYVVQSTGDGIFALFGAPAAHEDHPQRALYSALRMQQDLEQYSAKVVADGSTPIQSRVGINTGEVVVRSIQTGAGQVEYTPIGHTTNLASRMQTAAPVGSIAVSEATRKLCEGYFILKPLGATKVKGVSEPVNMYEVIGLGPLRTRLQRAVGRGLTKFVGREREMEALKHAAGLAQEGRGQIAAAVAEAGTGKSRLFFEFKAASAAGWMVLETVSVSHGKASAYLPVIDLLRNYFDISSGDDERKRREKVAGRITILDRALEDTLPYLFGLLGIVEGDDPLAQMDGQVKKRRTLEAIKRILLRESLNQPLMVIFEDLHWIDEQTQELLNLLADSIGTAKFLLLANYRPEYSHQWNNKTYYTQLRLDPLGKESAEEMLSALLGDGHDLQPLKRLIIERTEGNPFFMEEMVQVLLDEGALVRDGTVVKLTRLLGDLKIPPTVQAILAARIDRLPPDEKRLLQTLAVLGREFALSLVRQVVSVADDDINQMLGKLQLAEFIYEQPAAGDIEYVFKHALTQEVAYNSLLIEQRKALHECAGQALESIFAEQLDDHLDELVRHYSRSDNAAKAVEYLGRAGRQAMQRSAHTEAIELLTSALELLRRLPDRPERDQLELELQTTLGPVLMITKGWAAPEVEQVYVRAHELSQQSEVATQRFSALIGLYGLAFERGKLLAARELEEQLLSFAQQQQTPALVLEAHHACWSTALSLGELTAAQTHIEKGLALYDPQLHHSNARIYTGHDPAVCGRAWGALTAWLQGYPAQALRSSDRAMAMARELGHPFTVAFSLNNAAQLHQLLRVAQATKEQAEAALALAVEGGFPYFSSWGLVLRGWALAKQGQAEEGIAGIRDGLAALRASGAELWRSYGLSLLAEAYASAGRINEGMTALAEALAAVQNNTEHWWEAELYRLKGELLLRHQAERSGAEQTSPRVAHGIVDANAAEAQNCFQRAIEIARKQSAKSLELRATASLSRLLDKQGRHDQARTMLAEIYGWFTEGFDTADLKDAKALLNELSG